VSPDYFDVKVMETSRTDFRMMTVDQKVVALAKLVRGGVITNDFNLNKIASVQGIPVINLNEDLRRSLKFIADLARFRCRRTTIQ
jgi:uncharacterized protein YacL